MKYCKECKVYLNEKLSHCPLCGSHPENAPEGGEFKTEAFLKAFEKVRKAKVKSRTGDTQPLPKLYK